MTTKSPLKQILDIRREEVPQALLMSLYFFLVIATFQMLRPLQRSVFLGFYDDVPFSLLGAEFTAAQASSIARLGNMLIALLAATAFIYLARTLRRQQLTYVFAAFSIACLALLSRSLAEPSEVTVWLFYWFVDLYNTLMVATFFAFLNDSLAPERAKRLYGVIVLGGVIGGVFGSTTLAFWITARPSSYWLWVAVGITVAVIAVAGLAGRLFGPVRPEPGPAVPAERESFTTSTRLVWRSKYLLAIVAIVGLYEMVSTLMNFQYESSVGFYLDGQALDIWIARVQATQNVVALVVQLVLTSFVMTRFGVGATLLCLPVAALLGSLGFLAAPLLVIGSFMTVSDNALNYSINQSGKEVLYTPTTRAEKYHAKAVIDMFIMRFAKAIAVFLSLGITTAFTGFESVRWLSVATVLILVAWIGIARYAGREFQRRSAAYDDETPRRPARPAAAHATI